MQEVLTDDEARGIIAENVRRLRGARSYSEIARACSTDDWKAYPATIQQVENQRHLPGAGLLARLAEALGVTPNDLLTPLRNERRKNLRRA